MGCAAHADRSVGIDLGTTNSAVAVRFLQSRMHGLLVDCRLTAVHPVTPICLPQVVEAGVPRIIPTADGRTTPSIVSLGPEGAVLVGAAAKR